MGGVKRSKKHSRKWCRSRSPPKKTQKHPHRNHKAIFSRPRTARPNFLSFALVREKSDKYHFQNDFGSAAPRPFLASKPNFDKNQKKKKKKKTHTHICKRPKNDSQSRCAKSRRFKTCGHALAPNCSQTPCLQAFRVPGPLQLDRHRLTTQRWQKKTEGEPRKKRSALIPQNAFFQKPPISHLRFSDVAKCKPQFRTIEQVVSETTGRLLTLPGPLINS